MEKNLPHNKAMKSMKDFSVPWTKSKADVWAEMENQLDATEVKVRQLTPSTWLRYAAAALVLLMGTGLFLRFYQTQLESLPGEHLTHQLPDGSIIELNSSSTLAYNPLWWRVKRELNFEGEAFFMVQKGKRFVVNSSYGSTEVLGTSFTIYSRDQQYEVNCHTGKVKVTGEVLGSEVILEPNEGVLFNEDGQAQKGSVTALPDPIPWKTQLFSFTSRSLRSVLDELERQYNVSITSPSLENLNYTGELDIRRDIEQSLHLVCKPFNFTFSRISNAEYQLVEME